MHNTDKAVAKSLRIAADALDPQPKIDIVRKENAKLKISNKKLESQVMACRELFETAEIIVNLWTIRNEPGLRPNTLSAEKSLLNAVAELKTRLLYSS
jgi:hypothetical protein